MCYTDRERFSVSVRVWDELCSRWLCLSRADTRRISGTGMDAEVCMCVFLTGTQKNVQPSEFLSCGCFRKGKWACTRLLDAPGIQLLEQSQVNSATLAGLFQLLRFVWHIISQFLQMHDARHVVWKCKKCNCWSVTQSYLEDFCHQSGIMFLMMEPNFHKHQSSHFFGIGENHTQPQAMHPGRAHYVEKLQEDEKSAGILPLPDSENSFVGFFYVFFSSLYFQKLYQKRVSQNRTSL